MENLTIDAAPIMAPERGLDVLALDDSLNELARFDPKGALLVELKFFGGLDTKEIAEAMKTSVRTVEREWRATKRWLFRQLN